jgi:hypothetical protein
MNSRDKKQSSEKATLDKSGRNPQEMGGSQHTYYMVRFCYAYFVVYLVVIGQQEIISCSFDYSMEYKVAGHEVNTQKCLRSISTPELKSPYQIPPIPHF